jgi:hypothetical protein
VEKFDFSMNARNIHAAFRAKMPENAYGYCVFYLATPLKITLY